ncbi:MAG: hypothetical protein IJ480_12470 [Clostridia bacterium]|nr:hypothetical protein [Clostridia bacterium]
MKRYILILLCFTVFLTGCGGTALEKSQYGERLENGSVEPVDPSVTGETEAPAGSVVMTTEFPEYPVGTEEITLIYTYVGEPGTSASYGPYYWEAEVYVSGKWRQIPFKPNETIPDAGGELGSTTNYPECAEQAWTYELTRLDYEFHPGRYRILKEFGGVVYAAEFEMVEE